MFLVGNWTVNLYITIFFNHKSRIEYFSSFIELYKDNKDMKIIYIIILILVIFQVYVQYTPTFVASYPVRNR